MSLQYRELLNRVARREWDFMFHWWERLNPILVREMLVIARSRRSYAFRALVALFVLQFAYSLWSDLERPRGTQELAQFSNDLIHRITKLHHGLALVLPIIFLCDSITSERKAGTLQLLLLTNLGIREIILGKFLSRMVTFAYITGCLLPIYLLLTLLGGTYIGVPIGSCITGQCLAMVSGAVTLRIATRYKNSDVIALVAAAQIAILAVVLIFVYLTSVWVYVAVTFLVTAWQIAFAIQSSDLANNDVPQSPVSKMREEDALDWAREGFPMQEPARPSMLGEAKFVGVAIMFFVGMIGFLGMGIGPAGMQSAFELSGSAMLIWTFISVISVIVLGANNRTLDRRAGLFELLLVTPLEVSEILERTYSLALWKVRWVFRWFVIFGILSLPALVLAGYFACLIGMLIAVLALLVATICALALGPGKEARIAGLAYASAAVSFPALYYSISVNFGSELSVVIAVALPLLAFGTFRGARVIGVLGHVLAVQLTFSVWMTEVANVVAGVSHGPIYSSLATIYSAKVLSSESIGIAGPFGLSLPLGYAISVALTMAWVHFWLRLRFDQIVQRPAMHSASS